MAERLALVIGEALSYGLLIFFTKQSGWNNIIIADRVEKIIIKDGSSTAICEPLEKPSDNPQLMRSLQQSAIIKSKTIGSWHTYGNQMVNCVLTLA